MSILLDVSLHSGRSFFFFFSRGKDYKIERIIYLGLLEDTIEPISTRDMYVNQLQTKTRLQPTKRKVKRKKENKPSGERNKKERN